MVAEGQSKDRDDKCGTHLYFLDRRAETLTIAIRRSATHKSRRSSIWWVPNQLVTNWRLLIKRRTYGRSVDKPNRSMTSKRSRATVEMKEHDNSSIQRTANAERGRGQSVLSIQNKLQMITVKRDAGIK